MASTKVMGFRGCYPVLKKAVEDDYPLEQVRDFQYLECNTSWGLAERRGEQVE